MHHDSPKLPVKRLLAFSEDQAKAIADYRFGHRIVPSERAAIRHLIKLGLDAAQRPQEVQR